jgi:hypothetical protein
MNEFDKELVDILNHFRDWSMYQYPNNEEPLTPQKTVYAIKQAIEKHVIGEDIPLPATLDGLNEEEKIRTAMAKGMNMTYVKQRQKLHGK